MPLAFRAIVLRLQSWHLRLPPGTVQTPVSWLRQLGFRIAQSVFGMQRDVRRGLHVK